MKTLLAFVACAFLFVTPDVDGKCGRGRMVKKSKSVAVAKTVTKSRGGRCAR